MSDRPITRDEELAEVPLLKAEPAAWPRGVRTIGIDEMENLGIDRAGVLYWNGRVVTIQKSLTLTFWQKVTTAVVTLTAALVSLSTVAQGVASYNSWACTVGWWAVCPLVP